MPQYRWKLFNWLNHLPPPCSVAADLTAVRCSQHSGCCCCWIGIDGNFALSVPAFSWYLDRPTKHSQGNSSLGRSLTMFGTFYLPKSWVDFKKTTQRYLCHSVAFHMLNSKDTEKVCGSLRWKILRFIYSKNRDDNQFALKKSLVPFYRELQSVGTLKICYWLLLSWSVPIPWGVERSVSVHALSDRTARY